jgi:dipeptidyl aminopeptidase/acylaminoacyl peptidase
MTLPPIPPGLSADELQVHRETRDWFAAVEGPGLDTVIAGWDPDVRRDGRTLAFTGFRRAALDEGGRTTIALVDTSSGELRTLGPGRHDHLPRWSPDGRWLAFLSDGQQQHGERLVWTAPNEPDSLTYGPELPGVPEFLDWSPTGDRLLVVVREEEVAMEGGQSWWPKVDRPTAPTGWRHLYVVDVATGRARRVSAHGWTVWEAVWAGDDTVAAVVSSGPGEEAWYQAELMLFSVTDSGEPQQPQPIHATDVQLGRPSASPSGRRIAIVESLCSDRSLVAGDLVLLEGVDNGARRLDTLGADVCHSAWRSDDVVFFVGVRDLQTVAGEVDLSAGVTREVWVSDGSTIGVYPEAVQDADGDVYAVAESYRRAPHAIAVRDGRERVLADLSHPGSEHLLAHAGDIERVQWNGEDGIPLDGFLVTPPRNVASPPYPVVLDIHGGPVWAWHNQFAMRGVTGPLLASRGYATLYVNQRGSTGKGQRFVRAIASDVMGADTGDFLTAVDHLVERGIADPKRIGLTGTSYGGTMSLWLIARDTRFAASVAVSGATDLVSFHYTTSIADFDLFFLPGDPLDPDSEYVRRSPLSHVGRVETPTLMIVGGQDRDVPSSQSLEMHRALTMRGAVSELVLYPEEGHVVGDFPAVSDAAARTVAWFERHMPANPHGQATVEGQRHSGVGQAAHDPIRNREAQGSRRS